MGPIDISALERNDGTNRALRLKVELINELLDWEALNRATDRERPRQKMAIMRLSGQPEKVRAASSRALETARGMVHYGQSWSGNPSQSSRDWPRLWFALALG